MSSLLPSRSEEELRSLRAELFSSAKLTGLVHPGDTLVRRLKRAVGPSLAVKYATDIAELCYALKHQQPVSRTLLKNGKRSATTFLASRLRNSSITSASNTTVSPTSSSTQQPYLTESEGLSSSHSTSSVSAEPNTVSQTSDATSTEPNEINNLADTSCLADTGTAITALTRELRSLRRDITQLRSEMLNQQCCHSLCDTESCSLYVKLKSTAPKDLSKPMLGDLLHCPILYYSIIRYIPVVSLRVEIPKTHLHTALTTNLPQFAHGRLNFLPATL